MDQLIKLVAEKTGLSPDQAKLAVDTVLGFLKTRLPAPLASQIDAALSAGGGLGQVGDVAKSLGGFFNKGS